MSSRGLQLDRAGITQSQTVKLTFKLAATKIPRNAFIRTRSWRERERDARARREYFTNLTVGTGRGGVRCAVGRRRWSTKWAENGRSRGGGGSRCRQRYGGGRRSLFTALTQFLRRRRRECVAVARERIVAPCRSLRNSVATGVITRVSKTLNYALRRAFADRRHLSLPRYHGDSQLSRDTVKRHERYRAINFSVYHAVKRFSGAPRNLNCTISPSGECVTRSPRDLIRSWNPLEKILRDR